MSGRRSLYLSCTAALLIAGLGLWIVREAPARVPEVEFGLEPTANKQDAQVEGVVSSQNAKQSAATVEAVREEVAGGEAAEEELDEFLRTGIRKSKSAPVARASVHGVVVDQGGKPVVAARVLGGLARARPGALLDALVNRDNVREVETDGAGRFELVGLDPGPFRLAVRAAGYAPHDAKPMQLATGDRQDLGQIRLARGVILAGKVLDAKGSPVAAAEIFLVSAPLFGPVRSLGALAASPLGTSDEEGRFELAAIAPGVWTLLVRHPEFPDATFEGSSDGERTRVDDLKFTLAAAAKIAGHIAKFEPRTLPLTVFATPAEGLALFKDTRPPGSDELWLADVRSAPVDEAGRFEIQGLAAEGRYALRATRGAPSGAGGGERMEDPWAPTIFVPAGATDCELGYRAGGSVEFQVVDGASGEPIERMQVRVVGLSTVLLDERGKPKTHFPGGRVVLNDLRPPAVTRLKPPRRGEVLRFETGVFIDAREYELGKVSPILLEPGEHLDLGLVRLALLPLHEVRVEDALTLQPISGARVSLVSDVPFGSRPSSFGVTRRDGLARLTSLLSPHITLRVNCEGYAPVQIIDPSLSFVGAPPFVVQMTRGARITATVRDLSGTLIPSARAGLKREGVSEREALARSMTTDANGVALFADLPGGVYSLSASRMDDLGATVRVDPALIETAVVADGAEVSLELRVGTLTRLSGTVLRGSEPLAGALISFAPGKAAFEDFGCNVNRFSSAPRLRTDEKGDFPQIAIQPGDYMLLIDHEELGVLTKRNVSIAEEPKHVLIDIADTSITGCITDARGAPVAGARVQLYPEARMWMRSLGDEAGDNLLPALSPSRALASTLTGPDGRYQLTTVPPNTSLQVVVTQEQRAAVIPGVVVREGEVRRFADARLSELGSLEIAVSRDALGEGEHYGARISSAERLDGVLFVSDAFDEHGLVRFEKLLPGSWAVTVFALDSDDVILGRASRGTVTQVGPGKVTECKFKR